MNAQVSAAAALACAGCVSYLGLDFRPICAIIGILAAFIVRVPSITSRTRVVPEASFMLLGMLGAFVVIVDRQLSPGLSFIAGILMGASASTFGAIGKVVFAAALRERFQAAGRLLFGLSPVPPPTEPSTPSDPAHAEPVARLWAGEQPATPDDMTEQLGRIDDRTP